MTDAPLILLAAGGTGGHLFPAEALGVELVKRGYRVRLVTDSRAVRYSGFFSDGMIDVVRSETVRGGNPLQLAHTGIMLGAGTIAAFALLRRLKPRAVVGFGGYPTVPPLVAAWLCGIPGIIHDANAVLGRANRFLARRASAIATSLPGEIVPTNRYAFYTYEAKYLDQHGAELKVPADLPEALVKRVQDLSVRAFRALGCEAMARVDFFLRPDMSVVVNEVNTIPGFTSISMYPKLWEASGIPQPELLDRLIELALARFARDARLKTSR